MARLLLVILLAIGLVADARIWGLLGNTAGLILGTWAVAVPLGTLAAVLVTKTDLAGRPLAGGLLVASLFIPLHLQAAGWLAGFGLQGWFIPAGHTPWLAGWTGAIWIHGLASVAWVAVIVGAGLRLVERELEEEALLSATAAQVLWRVTLPRSWQAIATACLWVAVLTAGEMTVTDLLQIRTLAEEIYTGFSLGDWTGGQALGWGPGGLIITVLVLLTLVACRNLTPSMATLAKPGLRLSCQRGRRLATLVLALIVLVVVMVPIANLMVQAGLTVEPSEAGPQRSWSVWKMATLVTGVPGRHASELGWSLMIALAASAAATFLAALLAWPARHGDWRAMPALFATALGLAIPGPVLGILIIGALNRPEFGLLIWLYDRTIFAPWLAQTVKALPLGTLVLWYALRTVSRETLDSAASEGASHLVRFVRIALAARMPALGVVWLIGFVLAFGELGATLLVSPPGMTTLPVRIFGLLHYGVQDQLAALCLAIVAMLAGSIGLIGLAWRRFQQDRGSVGQDSARENREQELH